tara:strand:+ start:6738 stop:7397 length:660 start_codon:yes stop_codon:yes gene_type:complete
MKMNRTIILAACALIPVSGFAASLLSDNLPKSGNASYPGTTSQFESEEVITTGAVYEFIVDETAGKGMGNTDPEILKFGTDRLFDGYNERVGNTAIYGAWHGSLGATILIDLQDTYLVEAVSASLRTNGRRGASTFVAQVSEDGETFTNLGEWDGEQTVLDESEEDPKRNVEVVIAADSPVPARYVKVYLSHWDKEHTKRILNQLVVGEIAVWGDEMSR